MPATLESNTVRPAIAKPLHEQLVAFQNRYRFASLNDALEVLLDGWERLSLEEQHNAMGRPLPVRSAD